MKCIQNEPVMDVKLSDVSVEEQNAVPRRGNPSRTLLVSSSAPDKDIICFKLEEAGFCSLDNSDGKLI